MKQTAVNNLIIELEQFAKFPMVDKATIEAAIDFAKLRLEMEKEQIIDFAKSNLDKALDLDVRTAYSKVEQYYNETYGK